MKLTCLPPFKTAAWRGPTRFDPKEWNASDKLEKANCYAYALNDQKLGWPYLNMRFRFLAYWGIQDHQQSTVIEGTPPKSLDDILAFDGFEPICMHGADPTKDHIIAFSNYLGHFYRMDSDGTWSHKNGTDPATNLDLLSNPISNISSAKLVKTFRNKTLEAVPDLRFFKGDKKPRIFPITELKKSYF